MGSRPVLTDQPLAPIPAGDTMELMVLAAGGTHCAGVDLATGALVRAWSPERNPVRLRPYDVVEAVLAGDFDAVPDPAQPEAIGLVSAPNPVGRITGRRCERLLRPLLHPNGRPLLGVSAPVIPFWERKADHPSIAIVEGEGDVSMVREAPYLSCRFQWQGHVRELPCLDRELAEHMDRNGHSHLRAGKGRRLVIAITAPLEGRCHKVVEAVLPRT